MEDTLGFDENTKKESSASEWQLGIHSDLSLATGSNRQSFQENLYVLPKKEELTNRQTISATLLEKLSFFCCYTSTGSKIEILCMQQNSVNRFFWFYMLNLICKSLPMTYVYIFLSTYAPDHHFFLPKMFPICYGLNIIIVITALFELFIIVSNTSLYFLYVITGLVYKIPWNRCPNETINFGGYTFSCYNLSEFSKTLCEENITHYAFFYSTSSKENFSLAQMEFFDNLIVETQEFTLHYGIMKCIIIAMWVAAAFLYKDFFKSYIWKILHYSHVALTGMLIFIFIHLVIVYEDSPIHEVVTRDEDHRKYLMNADFDLLAESMTAPPIAHIISSRSRNEINPSRNSAAIIIANAIYYLFRALTTYLMKKYCENWIKGSIIYWNYGSWSLFYFWPIYFATLCWGDFFVIVFFALNGIVDYCTFFITFSCLLETIACEWISIKPWFAVILIFIAAGLEEYFNEGTLSENCFVFWTATSTLAEAIIIFWFYPLGRLADDITFHYGLPPTKLRVWSFTIVPIYYSIKIYIIISRFTTVTNENLLFKSIHSTRSSFLCQAVLFGLGAAYAFYYHVLKQKKSWTHLFKPAPEWGPKDFHSRQLRKQFDSRDFISSQAPRVLSRYLISKAERKSYKLDIPYESVTRRTTVQTEKEIY